MNILEEFKELVKNTLSGISLLLVFAFFFFLFGLKEVVIWGGSFILAVPSENSFSVLVFRKIQLDLLPSDVHLIVTNPLSAFISQVELSLLLAFLITFPYLLYKITGYLTPALFQHEQKIALKA